MTFPTSTPLQPRRSPLVSRRRTLRRFARLPSVALLLAFLWVPYTLIHCPSCVSAATSPFHCLFASTAPVANAAETDAHDHCHRKAAEKPASDTSKPDAACCALQPVPVAATAPASDLLPSPGLVAALPAPSTTGAPAQRHPVDTTERPSCDAHPPPRYVLFRSLIL